MNSTTYYKTSSLALLCLLAGLLSLLVSDSGLDWAILTRPMTLIDHEILWRIRVPHTLNAFIVGGLLALSGYLMQSVLVNPLADPYTLGTSGGAAVFTLIGLMLGLSEELLLPVSFMGALSNMLLLYLLMGRIRQTNTAKLLLFGVILAAGWGAILSLLLFLAPALQTKSMLFWLFGDLDYQHAPLLGCTILIIATLLSFRFVKQLELLRQGILFAKTLGVEAERLQTGGVLLASILTATAVSMGGTIGFIGLIVPHCAQSLHRRFSATIVFTTVILGAIVLLSADLLARIAIPPEQLPIGLITTLIGIPLFIYLSKKYHD